MTTTNNTGPGSGVNLTKAELDAMARISKATRDRVAESKGEGSAAEIIANDSTFARLEALLEAAPETRPVDPPSPPKPRVLNESFWPDYREPWEVTDPGSDFESKLAKAKRIICENGIGLLVGGYGTGKTRILAEASRETYHRGARYMTTSKFFRTVRATYARSSNKTEDDVIEELVRLPLLCLDEIDKRSDTKNENSLLFALIDERFNMKRPTLIAGNIDPKNINAALDEAILDRVFVGGGLIRFEGESFRRRRP